MATRHFPVLILLISLIIGCTGNQEGIRTTSTPTTDKPEPMSATIPPTVQSMATKSTGAPKLLGYQFPTSIDPDKHYLIYLHGRIIEDQGIPAISPDYGEYEIEAILGEFSEYGFVVISEQRGKNADVGEHARRVREQVSALLQSGVAAENITIVGASKGAYIAILASHLLDNKDINYVILGICSPEVIDDLLNQQIHLSGNVLSIYDSIDEYAGSCQQIFTFSADKGISRYDEIILNLNKGHGMLYKPLDEWLLPVVDWATSNAAKSP